MGQMGLCKEERKEKMPLLLSKNSIRKEKKKIRAETRVK